MRFRKLRLTGFKSFVEPAELLIEPGLTGIVGPNGCGKSNLLEAIRWVMGEGSPKSLRGGGMDDVIFAGTASRPARDFAEVVLLVETRDEAAGAWTEQEIVRRIERGAGSAYRLNARDVRQRDVALLFADAATGAHSPALVSQGRIAAVIAAKPPQRREMLEEAAGIAGLHVRRREAELRLRATETNLQRLDELLHDMDGRANALRRQARAAERYRTLSADIRIAEARGLLARWRAAAAAAKQAHVRAAEAEDAVHAAAEKQRAAAAHASAGFVTLSVARAAADAARESQSEARHALEAVRTERSATERRLSELAGQMANLARDREREDRLAIDAAAALSALDDEDKALGEAISTVEAERAGLDTAVADAERAVRDAEVAVAQALARAAREEADIRVAEAALAAARQRHARAEAEARRIERDIAALGDPARLDAAYAEAQTQRSIADTDAAIAVRDVANAEAARDAASEARDTAEAAAGLVAVQLGQMEAEAKALSETIADDIGDKALARLRVTPGYERALAAALGDDLEAPIGNGGTRGWIGAAIQPTDLPLPAGAVPLAGYVTGGGALCRRLAQIGVVDLDDGAPLAAGQRLVTKDGGMRRWDGYYVADSGAAAADALLRVNRHAALHASLPAARITAGEADMARQASRAAFSSARIAVEESRRSLAQVEEAARRAVRAEDAAAAACDRHAAARDALAGRHDRAAAERDEAAASLETTGRAITALPDPTPARAQLDGLEAIAGSARASLAAARARAQGLADALRRDQQRQQAARGEAKGWRSRAGDAARRIGEMAGRLAQAEGESAALVDRPEALALAIAAAEAILVVAERTARTARDAEVSAESGLRDLEALAAVCGETLANAREARATIAAHAAHQEERRQELSRLAGERFQCPAAILPERVGFDGAMLETAEAETAHHDRLSGERDRLGPVNLVAESELAELDQTRTASAADAEELRLAVDRLRSSIGSLNREGRQRLLAAFEAVDGHFRRLFDTLFGGGEAHLALIDSDDPLDAGLEIMAQPPGKRLGSLTLLSGGEQALTAIALIFALFLTNPAPICVLDEVDAPLDDANIERFCDLLIAMTGATETRYLVVTHNAVTMSRMHRLFGVTMIERGISRLVSVDLGGAETLLAAE